jgi:hypothetical protein
LGVVQAPVRPVAHWTQLPVAPHTGVVPEQSVGVEGLHARHTLGDAASQIGVPAGQLALLVQTQELLVQVPVVQLVPALHCTHRPMLVPDVAQNAVGALQSVLAEQARHLRVVVSQMGVVPAHSALVVHASAQPSNEYRHTPGWAGTRFDVVARSRTAAVREPGSCQ